MKLAKNLIWILMALAVSACGKPADVLDVGAFAPYVEKFEAQSSLYGKQVQVTNLVIQYGQMSTPSERGVCILDGDATPKILVREDTWNAMAEAEREELMFHEMGHCVLHRVHNPSLDRYGWPTSIMNPYLIQGTIYEYNRKLYLTELFAGR